jgi:hypothetical protein
MRLCPNLMHYIFLEEMKETTTMQRNVGPQAEIWNRDHLSDDGKTKDLLQSHVSATCFHQ